MLRCGRVGAVVVVAGMAEAGGTVAAAILEEVTAGAVGAAIMVVEVTGEATIVAGVMRPMAWAWG